MRVLREGPVRITKATIEAAWKRRAPDQRRVIGDVVCPGLALIVNPTGMTWRFDYKPRGINPLTGKRFASQSAVIGNPASHSVEDARTSAAALKGRVQAGGDPAAERKAELAAGREAKAKSLAEALTVKALIDTYAEKHVATLRPATQRDVLSRLRLHLRPIEARAANAIGRTETAQVLDAAAKAGETTARRVRDYARAMWGWAQRRGTLSENKANPWENAPAPGIDVSRDRVLSADELGMVWRAAGALDAPYGASVRFLLLTLARREEVAAMRWGEVAADLSTWTQPAVRTKNRKAHVVHLSEQAREILRERLGPEDGKPLPELPAADALVFGIGTKPITTHSWVKRSLDALIMAEQQEAADEAGKRKTAAMPHWVLHDFRRSGVTWLATAARVPPHVADRLLNHVQGTIKGVGAIYQRGEFLSERASSLETWGQHVADCGRGGGEAHRVIDFALRRVAKAGG